MPQTPKELHTALAHAFNSKDIENVIALYEENATLVPQPDQLVNGREKVKEALQGFLSIEGEMEIETVYCLQVGDVALTRSSWKITNNGTVGISASGTELMRMQRDGTWLFAVDHPFGAQ